MSVESAPFINGLNPLSPPGTDPVAEGYKHLNLIKGAITATFPKIAGAVTASDVDLNNIYSAVVSGTNTTATISGATVTANSFAGGGGQLVPTGSVLPFAGPNAPTGYLFCNGQAVSRTTFAALFAAIGGFYGAGDGSTTFNVPDLREVGMFGVATMGGTGVRGLINTGITPSVNGIPYNVLGTIMGETAHQLNINEIPSHNHPGTFDQGHTHGVSDFGHTHPMGGNPNGVWFRPGGGTAIDLPTPGPPAGQSGQDTTTNLSVGSNGTGIGIVQSNASIVVEPQGGSGFHNSFSMSLGLNFIIKI